MAGSPTHHFLLTGANGFIATHILSQLLTSGHRVSATVRSESKAAALQALFPSIPTSQLTIWTVPDMAAPGDSEDAHSFEGVFAGSSKLPGPPIDTILHTASPFLYRAATQTNAEDFLHPAIKGTRNLLSVARKWPAVKRVVMTSSCAAVIDYKREAKVEKEGGERKIYVEADWNDVTYPEGEKGDKSTAYRASKKFSELAAWGFVGGVEGHDSSLLVSNSLEVAEKGEAGFDLVVLCPPAVFGPVVEGSVKRIEDLGESNTRFWKLFVDSQKDKDIANKMPLHVYVDVRDLAKAHILAALTPDAGNKRFLICAGSFSNRDVTSALRSQIPDLEARTPISKEGSGLSETDYGYSSERAIKVLGMVYNTKEDTFIDLARQLLNIEKSET